MRKSKTKCFICKKILTTPALYRTKDLHWVHMTCHVRSLCRIEGIDKGGKGSGKKYMKIFNEYFG